MVWSDEKLFVVEPAVNKQNDRVLAISIAEANKVERLVGQRTHAPQAIVFAAVTKDGKSLLVFVDSNVKINSDGCIDILEHELLPWTAAHFEQQPFCFHQDGAPAHRPKKTQNWCAQWLPDFLSANKWPANAPDLSSLDYSVWPVLEKDVCASRHPHCCWVSEARPRQVLDEIGTPYLQKVCAAAFRQAPQILHRGR